MVTKSGSLDGSVASIHVGEQPSQLDAAASDGVDQAKGHTGGSTDAANDEVSNSNASARPGKSPSRSISARQAQSKADAEAAEKALGTYAPRKAVLTALEAQLDAKRAEPMRGSGSPVRRNAPLRKGQGHGGKSVTTKVAELKEAKEEQVKEELARRVDRRQANKWRERVEATKRALSSVYNKDESAQVTGPAAMASTAKGQSRNRGRIQTPPDLETDYGRMMALGVIHSAAAPGIGSSGGGSNDKGEAAVDEGTPIAVAKSSGNKLVIDGKPL